MVLLRTWMQNENKSWTSQKFWNAISECNVNTNCYLRTTHSLHFLSTVIHMETRNHIFYSTGYKAWTMNIQHWAYFFTKTQWATYRKCTPYENRLFLKVPTIWFPSTVWHMHTSGSIYSSMNHKHYSVCIYTRTFSLCKAANRVPENKISVFETKLIRLVAEQGTRTSAHPPHIRHIVRNINEYCFDKCVDVSTVWGMYRLWTLWNSTHIAPYYGYHTVETLGIIEVRKKSVVLPMEFIFFIELAKRRRSIFGWN